MPDKNLADLTAENPTSAAKFPFINAGGGSRLATKEQLQALVSGAGVPAAFTSRALADADNGTTQVCASAQTATVNSGHVSGFGLAFKGTISFTAGSGVAITDSRSTGATAPFCALVQIAADTYEVRGVKA